MNNLQSQNHRPPLSTANVQQPTISTEIKTTTITASRFMRRLFGFLFSSHLILIAALVIFLAVQGLHSGVRHHHFRPAEWYYPLLASTGCAAILSLLWQWIIACSPSKAFKAAFWLAPLSTCAVAVLLLTIGSSADLVAGVAALLFSLSMSLYGCWVSPRFEYAIRVLTVSAASPPAKATSLVMLSMLISTLYSCLLVIGIGGARARANLDALFISIILLSLAWTMQVIRNTLLATFTRVKYMYLVSGIDVKTSMAFRDMLKHSMGSICIGSFLVPILGLMWGSARAMKLVEGGIDEFLFSCANCYAGCASTLVMYGNRWGFVHVGVYNKGFMQASMDVWNTFRRMGLEELIGSDLTGSFCFLSSTAVGGICSLVSGIWALAVRKSYARELSLYAFFISYFMGRIAMAWQQACLTAYYVAYAENPQSSQFDNTIPARIQQLQRLGA
ncbi:Choline transporter-like [Parasponia andersonii]|uniref:Choline transporter-like protein n=1 Tax=Parasponia andersonii TaxID=3476 RepID=A0A2P5AP56_PARAD|nr:Choline transporter-like [Parasponia andersonii]